MDFFSSGADRQAMMLLHEREEKQKFLKKEIVDKGYKGDEFAQYLTYKKGSIFSHNITRGRC